MPAPLSRAAGSSAPGVTTWRLVRMRPRSCGAAGHRGGQLGRAHLARQRCSCRQPCHPCTSSPEPPTLPAPPCPPQTLSHSCCLRPPCQTRCRGGGWGAWQWGQPGRALQHRHTQCPSALCRLRPPQSPASPSPRLRDLEHHHRRHHRVQGLLPRAAGHLRGHMHVAQSAPAGQPPLPPPPAPSHSQGRQAAAGHPGTPTSAPAAPSKARESGKLCMLAIRPAASSEEAAPAAAMPASGRVRRSRAVEMAGTARRDGEATQFLLAPRRRCRRLTRAFCAGLSDPVVACQCTSILTSLQTCSRHRLPLQPRRADSCRAPRRP